MMRNEEAPAVQGTEIVHTFVTGSVHVFMYDDCKKNVNAGDVLSIKNIHLYLSTHHDILTKKFIFFTINEKQQHWKGWAVVNPWVQLARIHYKRAIKEGEEPESEFAGYDLFVNGLIACNGFDKKMTMEDVNNVIWLLLLASAYRDINL